MLEHELISAAIAKLNQQTDLDIDFRTFKDGNIDGELVLPHIKQPLIIECKKWLNTASLQKHLLKVELLSQTTQVVLVTEYINPNQATTLKRHKVPFVDVAGNVYINQPPIYIDIQGKTPKKPKQEEARAKQLGKAFQPKGMKVVLMMLLEPDLVTKPMRTIADVAQVALGTVKQVIDDLIYQNLIVQKDQKTKVIVNPEVLLEKWFQAYPTAVEAKLAKGVYIADNVEKLRGLNVQDIGALWGGEYAAELCDRYLNAKDYLLYVMPEHKNELIKLARLRKEKTGETLNTKAIRVIIAEPPLEIEKLKGHKDGVVHPYLVYANLLTSSDPRTLDAARRFYENYIA